MTCEFASTGINDGASCWVSTNIEAGKTNHESEANFSFQNGGVHCYYAVSGGTLTPSFSGVTSCLETADPTGIFHRDANNRPQSKPTPCDPNL